jgi:hypothetical protein
MGRISILRLTRYVRCDSKLSECGFIHRGNNLLSHWQSRSRDIRLRIELRNARWQKRKWRMRFCCINTVCWRIGLDISTRWMTDIYDCLPFTYLPQILQVTAKLALAPQDDVNNIVVHTRMGYSPPVRGSTHEPLRVRATSICTHTLSTVYTFDLFPYRSDTGIRS